MRVAQQAKEINALRAEVAFMQQQMALMQQLLASQNRQSTVPQQQLMHMQQPGQGLAACSQISTSSGGSGDAHDSLKDAALSATAAQAAAADHTYDLGAVAAAPPAQAAAPQDPAAAAAVTSLPGWQPLPAASGADNLDAQLEGLIFDSVLSPAWYAQLVDLMADSLVPVLDKQHVQLMDGQARVAAELEAPVGTWQLQDVVHV